MKKVFAVFLAVMMIAALAVSATAEERFEFKDFSFATDDGWTKVQETDGYILVANKGGTMPLATMVVSDMGVDEDKWGDVTNEQMLLYLYDVQVKSSYDEYVSSQELLYGKPVLWYSFKKSAGYQTWVVVLHNNWIVAFGYSTGSTSKPDDTADLIPYMESLQYKGENVFQP